MDGIGDIMFGRAPASGVDTDGRSNIFASDTDQAAEWPDIGDGRGRAHHPTSEQPPSITTVDPVMFLFSGWHRCAACRATSSGLINLFSGIFFNACSRSFGFCS